MQDETIQQLRERLQPFSPHLQVVLNGIVASFGETTNSLRFPNTGNGLRELLRELFYEMAPDHFIKDCKWFEPDPNSKCGITRKHRAMFAVYSYLEPAEFPTTFVTTVDDLSRNIGDNVARLNKFTHFTKDSLETSEEEATSVFTETLGLFHQLFKAITSAREHVREELESILCLDLAVLFTSEFFEELDTLSTHTRPQDAENIRVQVRDIRKEVIQFSGTGSLTCDLQYGSDGDCRRGDGLEFTDSFLFTFTGQAQIDDPQKVKINPADIKIDTSSFWFDR